MSIYPCMYVQRVGAHPRLIYIYICWCHHHHTACKPGLACLSMTRNLICTCEWMERDPLLYFFMLCFLFPSLTLFVSDKDVHYYYYYYYYFFFWGIARHVNNKRADFVLRGGGGAKHRRFENIIPPPSSNGVQPHTHTQTPCASHLSPVNQLNPIS